MGEEEQQDMEEEQAEDRFDQTQELTEDATNEYGYPQEKVSPNIAQVFNKVIDTADNSKVGNLKAEELGGTKLPVRDYQTLANLAAFTHQDKLAQYFMAKAQIALSTSLSKEGFLLNTIITQRKEKMKKEQGGKMKLWEKRI